jgi:hypothetical protein
VRHGTQSQVKVSDRVLTGADRSAWSIGVSPGQVPDRVAVWSVSKSGCSVSKLALQVPHHTPHGGATSAATPRATTPPHMLHATSDTVLQHGLAGVRHADKPHVLPDDVSVLRSVTGQGRGRFSDGRADMGPPTPCRHGSSPKHHN